MNRIKREWLSIYRALSDYLAYRAEKDYRENNYLLEFKGEGFYKWKISDRNRLLQFENKHNGEDCFIIGNGPSLNKMNLSALSDYYTIGLNKIFLIFKKVIFDLNYIVAVNPLVIEQSIDEYLKMDIPIFLSLAKYKYNISKSNIYGLYTNANWGFYTNPHYGISEGYTVTFTAMQLAYYMGFKRVFLIGVDHNFYQNGNPNERQRLEEDDINHFDPKYFKGYNWNLADLEASEISYRLAKRFYDDDKRQIIDSTIDGKLSIFEKVKFEDALIIAKKKRDKASNN